MASAAPIPFSVDSAQDINSAFRGFSCPFEEFVESLAPLIAAEYSRGISRIFLEKHRTAIDHSAPGLLEALSAWCAGADVPHSGWDLCFGDVYRAMHLDISEPWGIAASIAMHLGTLGMRGGWQARIRAPLRFRWGRLLLPPAISISVESDGRLASITTHGDDCSMNHIMERISEDVWGGNLERIPRVTRFGFRIDILHRGALVLRDFDDMVAKALPYVDPRMVDVLDRAVQLIASYAPIYVPWVRRAVHNLFILYPRSDTIESGSVEHYLGLIHLSAHAAPLPIAELLVHEAAHQHMNLLTKLGPIDDGSDIKSYYSPPVDKHRKLSLIMAAYHAFANVLLFYRLCRENGIEERRECDRQESILLPWLEKLEGPLSNNSALTEIGRALWQPLKSQLQVTA